MTSSHADGMRDAAAWLQATDADDVEGFHAVATHCNQTQLIDSLTAAFLWIIRKQNVSLSTVLRLMRDSADRLEEKDR